MSALRSGSRLALLLCLVGGLGASSARAAVVAGEQRYSVRFGYGQAYQAFLDPAFVGRDARDYISRPYSLFRVDAEFRRYFPDDLAIGYSLLQYDGASKKLAGEVIELEERRSDTFHLAIIKEFNLLRISYGTATMMTTHVKERQRGNKHVETSIAYDTHRSNVYPSLGLYLFPHDVVGVNIAFLDKDANLMNGWLTSAIRYDVSEAYQFHMGVEFFNERNFRGPQKGLLRPAGAFFSRIQYQPTALKVSGKLGVVLVESQRGASVISMADRFFTEVGVHLKI